MRAMRLRGDDGAAAARNRPTRRASGRWWRAGVRTTCRRVWPSASIADSGVEPEVNDVDDHVGDEQQACVEDDQSECHRVVRAEDARGEVLTHAGDREEAFDHEAA